MAPIVPLVDRLNPSIDGDAEIPLPTRPHATDVDLDAVRAQVKSRVNLVAPRLIDGVPISGFLRGVLHGLWRAAILFGLRGKIVDGRHGQDRERGGDAQMSAGRRRHTSSSSTLRIFAASSALR